jgi:hypothetical protein
VPALPEVEGGPPPEASPGRHRCRLLGAVEYAHQAVSQGILTPSYGGFWVSSSASRLRTVGLVLGPYRNLTTLTASLLSLHPEVQVLNHAGSRLLKGRRDFIRNFDKRRVNNFCKSALKASTSGSRQDHGGSIQLSHAFDRSEMQQLYQARYGDRLIKDDVRTLVWKESGFATNRIRQEPQRMTQLLEGEPRLRFLLPVRHPFDCAQSNMRTGHAARIKGADPKDISSVLDRIVEMIGWFGGLMKSHPDRFFLFFENDEPVKISDGFLRVLELSDDAQWRGAFDAAFAVKGKKYEYPSELYESFNESVRQHLAGVPNIASRVTALVQP